MSERQRLPNRRQQRTRGLVFDGQRYILSVGFHPVSGQALELFIESAPQRDEGANHGPKVGTGLALLLQDWAVTTSLALQHGVRPADLAKSLARVPALGEELFAPAKEPASVVGALLDLVVVTEDEYGREPENGAAA